MAFSLRETWFEKLERWEEALEFYKKREQEFPEQAESLISSWAR